MQTCSRAADASTPRTAAEPLSPFDHLMLADARPGHPMCFFLECIVEGDLDRDRLRQAIGQAAVRHPRLCSRVAWRRGRPYWLAPDVSPAFVWGPDADGADPWRPIDLRHESGVRVVVRTIAPRYYGIVMFVHHSVCDGIAACEYVGDVWACYEGIAPRGFSRPSAGTAERDAPQAPGDGPPVDVADETWAFVRFRPATLARRQAAARAPATGTTAPPYATIELDEAFTASLRAAATARNATLNDLILTAVMRAALAWNAKAGRRPRGVRVTMPVSIRVPRQREPARNQISYAFLDRSPAACGDRETLVGSLAAANRWILASGVVDGFLQAIRFLTRRPWLLEAVVRLPLCLSTMIVSNVGDVSRRMRAGVPKIDGRDAPGGLIVRGFRGVPPLRPKTRAALAVSSYAGTMSISCLCSAGPDPHAAASALLDEVRDELDQIR